MKSVRRFVLAFTAALLGIVFVPPTPAPALPQPAQLIPCSYSGAVDHTVLNGSTVTLNTDTLAGIPSAVTAVVDGAAVFVFRSLTIGTNALLIIEGSRPAAILAQMNIVVSSGGEIRVTPGAVGGAAPGSGPGAGQAAPGYPKGGGGGGFGGIGGAGGDSGGAGGATYNLTPFVGGSGGGAADGVNGGGGGALALIASNSITNSGTISAAGQDGQGQDSGAGGGSGGSVVLQAPRYFGGGVLRLRGGAGGSAYPGGGGGGGGGGRGLYLVAQSTGSDTLDIAGGAGGPAPSPGSPGGNGSVVVTGDKQKIVVAWPGLVRQSTSWSTHFDHTNAAFTPEFTYGVKPLVPIMGDWNGDKQKTPGYYNAGVFHLRNSDGGPGDDLSFTFGDARGFPVVGDWNGDGLDDVATYLNGVWKTRITGCGFVDTFTFGSGNWPATVPVAGDWNGDGLSGVGTYNLAAGTWTLRTLPTSTPPAPDLNVSYPGVGGYYPVPGDWNADGTETIAVKATTPATSPAVWLIRNTIANGTTANFDLSFTYGLGNDFPVVWSTASGA